MSGCGNDGAAAVKGTYLTDGTAYLIGTPDVLKMRRQLGESIFASLAGGDLKTANSTGSSSLG